MEFLVPDKIETQRLILRQFEDKDWLDLHHYYSSVEATKFTLGRGLTEGETWRTMCGMIGHWQLRGYGTYAVQEKTSGVVIGTVGFWFPNDWPSPEIKWALAPKYWGKGYASEAARAVKEIGFECLPQIPWISLIHGDNNNSIQLALALGAKLDRKIEFRGGNWHVYQHSNEV